MQTNYAAAPSTHSMARELDQFRSLPLASRWFTNNMIQDAESSHQDYCHELNSILLFNAKKRSNRKETRMASAQFLVYSWYGGKVARRDFSFLEFKMFTWFIFSNFWSLRLGSEPCLGYSCRKARSVIIIGSWWPLPYTIFREYL